MPSFTDISSITLDKFQMKKNPTPKDNPTDNQYFVYIDFPAQGYPIQFQKMIFNSTNNPLNILNFNIASNNYPILYFAKNSKFQNADLQNYIPVGMQIVQKVHNTNIMSTSTSDDLQMIIECNQVSGSNVLFIHILLTNDTQSKNNGDDFNKLFDNFTYIDQLETNTKNFETQNLKPPPFKYNFLSGIVNQFESDDTSTTTTTTDNTTNTENTTTTDNTTTSKSMKCFYYKDSKNNTHIILQKPILINSKNFVKIQEFYKNVGLAMSPFTIYQNSNLFPEKSAPIILDVLLGTKDSLQNAQTTPPLTADGKKDQQKKTKKAAEAKNNTDAAKKAEKAGSESFLSSYRTTEGLETKEMNCRVSSSSDQLITTLVSDNLSSALDGYIFIIAIGSIIILFIVIFFWVSNTKFLIPITRDTEKLKNNFENFEKIFKLFNDKKNYIYFIYALFAFFGFCLFIPAMIPNISPNAKFPCIIIGLLLFTSIPYIYFLITYICNSRLNLNRYKYAYSIIKDNLSTLGTCSKQFENIDKNIPSDDKSGNLEQQYFIFINQCMSHYFGDNNWFLNRDQTEDAKNNKTQIQKIEISEDTNNIIVTLKNTDTYKYKIADALSCAINPANP